jgi:dihydropteroate synthase
METNFDRPVTVMGILNLTGDSFYAGSRFLDGDGRPDLDALQRKAAEMIAKGARILDLGACSTRPGSQAVGAAEEWRRLSPALRCLRDAFPDTPLSIDTWWSEVILRATDAVGAVIVNDISAGEDDPAMLSVAARNHLTYIAMHKRGTPATMQGMTDYPAEGVPDGLSPVTAAVRRYFEAFAQRAQDAGLEDWILDPGFGFAKTVEQNWQLLRELSALRVPGRRMLVGISRKRFLWQPLGICPEEALPATQTAHLAALQGGADILRVHDVAPAVQAVGVYRQLAGAGRQ